VTFPVRITSELVSSLKVSNNAIIVVTHFNHPKELTPESIGACSLLRRSGVWLLNQSVLLRKVNDSAETLRKLSESLFTAGIAPYYLHHPDPAKGTGHFSIAPSEGWKIYQALKASQSGYLVPRYVIDTVENSYKLSIEEYLSNPAR